MLSKLLFGQFIYKLKYNVNETCLKLRPARQILFWFENFGQKFAFRQVIFTSIPDMGTKFNGYFTQVYGLFGSSD